VKRLIFVICLIALAHALVGCNAHVYSPPARVAPMESSKPVARGQTSGGVAAGTGSAIFGVETHNATARVRHGVTDHSELGVDANLMVVDDSEAAAEVNPYIWSARVGGKWAPQPLQDHLGLVYGVGGGTSAGGQFISPDVGVVAAFENPYLVPFVSANGFVSEPINAQPVDVSNKDQGEGTKVMTAKTTWGATFAGGLKWPIVVGGSTVAPIVGLSHTLVTDGDEDTEVTGLSVGADVAF
jgi:hypothetical protein